MPRYVENCCGLCPWPLHSRHDLARWLIRSYFRIEENGLPWLMLQDFLFLREWEEVVAQKQKPSSLASAGVTCKLS